MRQRALAGVAIIWALIATPLVACTPPQDLLWDVQGEWIEEGNTTQPLNGIGCVNPAKVRHVGKVPGKIYFITSEKKKKFVTCASPCKPSKWTEEPLSSGSGDKAGAGPSFWAAITGGPRPVEGMSRSSSWRDAIAALDLSGPIPRVNLLETFRSARQREIKVRLCTLEADAVCSGLPLAINWNGTSAILASAELKPGLWRIVEDDDASDAWIRVVAQAEEKAVRSEYADALKDLETWVPSAEYGPAPDFSRMRRIYLRSAGRR